VKLVETCVNNFLHRTQEMLKLLHIESCGLKRKQIMWRLSVYVVTKMLWF